MTKKQISKRATRYNMYLAENGIEGVYEIRYTNSNSIVCLSDYDLNVGRYGREQKSNFELNEVQRDILISMYEQFPSYFFISSDNTFSTDEQKYMFV